MKRGTTPTITMTADADLTNWTVYTSIRGKCKHGVVTFDDSRLTKTYDGEITTMTLTLTQEETLALDVGMVEFQLRAIKDGTAIATTIEKVPVGRILQDGVIDE